MRIFPALLAPSRLAQPLAERSPTIEGRNMSRKITGAIPNTQLPAGSIDSHMHIYGRDFSDQPGGPPSPPDFAGLNEYREVQKWLGLERLVLVQANAHQRDNSCLLNALAHFGDKSRGIACIRPATLESTVASYHQQGVRAARIMSLGGGTSPGRLTQRQCAGATP